MIGCSGPIQSSCQTQCLRLTAWGLFPYGHRGRGTCGQCLAYRSSQMKYQCPGMRDLQKICHLDLFSKMAICCQQTRSRLVHRKFNMQFSFMFYRDYDASSVFYKYQFRICIVCFMTHHNTSNIVILLCVREWEQERWFLHLELYVCSLYYTAQKIWQFIVFQISFSTINYLFYYAKFSMEINFTWVSLFLFSF